MWRATVKGVLAHKLRLALTGSAIVLGVMFVAGTLELTDTLHATFTNLFDNVYQDVSFVVRGHAAFTGNTGAIRNPIPESVASTVRAVPGVAAADGAASGYAQFVAPDGKAVTTGGAPTIGTSFEPNPMLSALKLRQGSAPTTDHQVVVDAGTAAKYHFHVGERVRILLLGPPQTFTVSGIAQFGTANNLAGATIAAFWLPTAQRLFDRVGQYDTVDVLAAPGADKAQVERAIAKVLPPGVEVVTGQTVADESSGTINQALGFFSTALLIFAFIALFVGGFTIFNTFSSIVGQRTRERALLRVLGASRRQVFRSVLAEAAIVGVIASLTGLGFGVLAAIGLQALLKGFWVTLPSRGLAFQARTLVARPMSSLIGRPLAALLGPSGKLGRENSMRSPKRTAQTAAALMIGLALVSTIAVFGASVSKSATGSIDQALRADYIVTGSASGGPPTGFSASVAITASSIPGVTAVTSVYNGQFLFGSAVASLGGVTTPGMADTINLRMQSGSGEPALASGQLLIDTTTANTKHLSVGDVEKVTFARTGRGTTRIGGIYEPNAVFGSYLVGGEFFLAHFDTPLPTAVLITSTGGTSPSAQAAVTQGLRAYPNVKVQTQAEFKKTQQAKVNQLLGIIYVLLALAVLIALIGIVNTLMLSVFERTHEIGLLRAVGMRRRQVRSMIRAEAVILSIFGAVIGVVLGTGLGVALSESLKKQGITDIVIPFSSLVVFLVIAALLGLSAASWPARRAAKLDVLAAIAAE